MTTLKTIAPNRQLRADAADSYNRMRHYGLPSGGVNSAYRSIASQDAIFRARYKKVNHKTNIYYDGSYWVHVSGLPVAVPGKSPHNKGLAMDIARGGAQEKWLMSHGAKNGWSRPLPNTDPVHWEYTPSKDSVLKKLKAAQKAVRTGQTGIVDSATNKAVAAVRASNPSRGTPSFPSDVRYAQTHVGTKADGRWGAKSKAANIKTTKAFQKAIGATPDGKWGVQTDTLWKNLGK